MQIDDGIRRHIADQDGADMLDSVDELSRGASNVPRWPRSYSPRVIRAQSALRGTTCSATQSTKAHRRAHRTRPEVYAARS